MKFNIFFNLRGSLTGNQVDCPNATNPAEVSSLQECMEILAKQLPDNSGLGIECVGVRIEKVED